MFVPEVYIDAYGGFGARALERGRPEWAPRDSTFIALPKLLGPGIGSVATSPYLTDTESLDLSSPERAKEFVDYAESARVSVRAPYALIKSRKASGLQSAEGPIPGLRVDSQTFVTSVLAIGGATEDQVFQSRLHSKRRKQVKKGEETGVRFALTRAENTAEFLGALRQAYEVIARTQRALGTPVHAFRFFESIAHHHRSEVTVINAFVGGECVATALLLLRGGTLYHPYTGTLEQWLPSYLNCTLYWEMIRYAIGQGAERFDLGRSFRGSGVHKFKGYWGSEDVPLTYAYAGPVGHQFGGIAPETPAMQLATRVWRHLPLSLTKALGPRRIAAVA